MSATDVTCPACGVLLAAYQAPAGATGSPPVATSQAPHEVTAPVVTPVPPPVSPEAVSSPLPVMHQPQSQSPIGDALRRSRESGSAEEGLDSDAVAAELASMATDDSDLAREVEAELAGARVTFDGNDSVIETERIDIGHADDGAPEVVEHEPTPPAPAANASPVAAEPPVARTTAPAAPPNVDMAGVPAIPPAPAGFDPATLVRWIPFILIGCVLLGIGRSLPGFGGVIGFALVIGLIYFLIRVAAATSRKTTSMPRDTTWNQGRSRWRK